MSALPTKPAGHGPHVDPAPVPLSRGLHSCTSQLNLSCYCHRTSMNATSVSLKYAHDKPETGRV